MPEQRIDRSKLTFSQAEGIDPLPQLAALGELPPNARTYLWNHLYKELVGSIRVNEHSFTQVVTDPWNCIFYDLHTLLWEKPADEFTNEWNTIKESMKEFLTRYPHNRIFDFLQFVLRHALCPANFYNVVEYTLEHFMCAYSIIRDGPTIIPIAVPEQRESVEKAFQVLSSGPFEGARSHLRKSVELIDSNDPAGSVRESIHAVESIARLLGPNANTSLSPALQALSEKGVTLHPAFKIGIEKLYGYTSDQAGIRHSLLNDNPDVDIEDAVFMFGACAAFSAYLVNKARKAGLQIEP